jgi:hypothetical protein
MVALRSFPFVVALLQMAATTPAAAEMEFATKGTHQLEKLFVENCQDDNTPHGFYGAFFLPCTFEFRQADILSVSEDHCSEEASTLVSKPVPMHWFFNLTEHFDKDDWDSMSQDDIPSAEELMFWPDQCVGAVPRCYAIADSNVAIKDTLAKLFPDGLPEEATHVRVDCTGDAVELSRLVYSFANVFDKNARTIMALMATVLLFSIVLAMWCIYACLHLCFQPSTKNFRAAPTHHSKSVVEYKILEEVNESEKEKLLKEQMHLYMDN